MTTDPENVEDVPSTEYIKQRVKDTCIKLLPDDVLLHNIKVYFNAFMSEVNNAYYMLSNRCSSNTTEFANFMIMFLTSVYEPEIQKIIKDIESESIIDSSKINDTVTAALIENGGEIILRNLLKTFRFHTAVSIKQEIREDILHHRF